MDSVLRPRDIQARIRSDESPETVAAAAQTSVDKIMGFATPVLAERAYIAEQALKASVRRRAGDGPIGHLGEAVEQRLATRDVDPQAVAWDAWRREDGRWTLVANYPAGAGPSEVTRAQFVYDQAGRYVMAEDDDARWLVGERSGTVPTEHVTVSDETVVETVFEPSRSETTRPGPSGPGTTEPEATVPEGPGDPDPEQLPLGDDAIGVVTGLRSAPEPPSADEWMLTQASDRTAPPRRVVEEPAETLFDTPAAEEPPSADPTSEPSPRADPVVDSEQADEPPPAADTPAKPRKSNKSKRASVPSWDEIMFGSGKGE
jgi:Protein of unknown function (DUF3071)